MMPEREPAILCESVRYRYRGEGGFGLFVDRLEIPVGSPTAFVGPSGCGKTTLLHLLTGVLTPDTGRVSVGGSPLDSMSAVARRAFRLREIGMVFQRFALIEALPAIDNIVLPYRFLGSGGVDRETTARARALADRLGLSTRHLRRRPSRLSQGEQQRVAICRALIGRPSLVVCDEPTANLDPDRARASLSLLLDESASNGATLLLATHDHGLLAMVERVYAVSREGVAAQGVGAVS